MDVDIEVLLQDGVRTSRAVYALPEPHGTYTGRSATRRGSCFVFEGSEGNVGGWRGGGRRCAQGRNRTSDTRIFSPLLYQLSYLGVNF